MPKRKVDHYDLKKHGVTQSLLGDFVDCRERARLGIQRWTPIKDKRSLAFGTMMHWFIEQWYSGSTPTPETYPYKPKDPEQKYEDLMYLASIMFQAYIERYEQDDKDKNWLSVEHKFFIEPDWSDIKLQGKVDGLYELHRNRRTTLWLLETKTAWQLDEDSLIKHLEMDWQSLFYVTCMEHILERRIDGVLYNVIVKPLHRVRKNESLTGYRDRLLTVLTEEQDKYFNRYEVTFTEDTKKDFKYILSCSIIPEFIRWVNGESVHYPNTSACIKRWKCHYHDICTSGGNTVGYYKRDKVFDEL